MVAAVSAIGWTMGLMCSVGHEELILSVYKLMGIIEIVPLQILYLHITSLLSKFTIRVTVQIFRFPM